jgi:hypothetical protein
LGFGLLQQYFVFIKISKEVRDFLMPKYTIRHDKNEPKGLLTGDGKLALGIAIGALSVILAIIAYEFFWGTREASDYFEVAPLIISLLVATASIYFAANALLEQKKTRQAGIDPVLVAHLGQREDARELITFNISNVGAGAALNVVIDADAPKDDLSQRNLLTNVFKRHHPFSVILQGKSIEFSLALGWNLLGTNPLPPFAVRLSYEDLAGGQYESLFSIDVRELDGLGANKSPLMRMVKALEKLAEKK